MKRLLIVAATVALLGAGCGKTNTPPAAEEATKPAAEVGTTTEDTEGDATGPETPRDPNQPISYDLGDINAIIERSLLLVRENFTPEMLTSMSEECGTNLSNEHFTELLKQFNYQRGHRYSFIHRDTTREPTTFTVTVIANGPEYETLEDFKKDFNVCAAGSILLPLDLNSNWLIFESGCGVSEDSGCNDIRTQVKETLKIH